MTTDDVFNLGRRAAGPWLLTQSTTTLTGAQNWWKAGRTGCGVDVALIDLQDHSKDQLAFAVETGGNSWSSGVWNGNTRSATSWSGNSWTGGSRAWPFWG